ncbi:MAG: hypothetical protein OQK29_01315 [Ignavibacteriaceae bacterium]|nr:hypothetical protein [Ignavibacteriaceae bacterium]
MKKLLFGLSILALITGCTNARISRNLSSGAIGCHENDITIKDERATVTGLHTWIAECKGHEFVCSYQESTGVNCKEALKEKTSE